jgi:hypothetical protein
MPNFHLYLRQDRFTASDQLWNDFVALVEGDAPKDLPDPELNYHTRLSLDGTELISESKFSTAVLAVVYFQTWFSVTLGVPRPQIGIVEIYDQYGYYAVYSYQGNDLAGVCVFGKQDIPGWPDYDDSHSAVLQYLSDNIAEWETAA